MQKTTLSVLFPTDLGFKTKEIRFDGYPIKKTADTKLVVYELQNIPAIKPEDLAPASGFLPKLMMAVEKFNLEGVDGTAATWKEYGLWFSEKILKDTDDLSDDAKQKAKELVGAETDPIKKAKIIYKNVQSKTRYISVQVGIGGFKPMHDKEVDRLGYGDCKALTNYTKSLLAAVDVPSYNTELFGDRTKLDIMSDFASLQGNHVMLCIPNNSKNIFLECTNQTNPFGYQANFTDDRSVLILKPDGGEIVKTKQYTDQENTQISNGKFELDENGNITGSISIISEESQYGKKLLLEKLTANDKDKHYKEYWDNIGNLKIVATAYKNDKDKISFDETVTITAENYGKMNGNDMLVPINCYNHYSENLSRIRNRKTPFEIQRGFYDYDEIEVNFSKNLLVSYIPEKVEINNKYVEYKTEIIKKDDQKLIYKRSFLLKSGLFPKTEYESYRQTMDQIERNDNAKIILTKN